ncbi:MULTISPECIES: co-chaperone DjlA [Actinobacillus]|uniref:Co-chaperone protein DjlA n=7 Tax=Actinobacillus TaxID=713 RepID=A3MZ24_ACTP2|nr:MULTISPECIES: co-chaperone DjlA [Actinobacillus]ABN73410.1 DnaJ-like protein DjlA [Actinobacillus pleuropneumoniae serovar 5b str. L20]ABY68912.1 DnaJ-like protein [Actinobacillus pleuropneumoniae serovar 3 str. JL03]ACE60963.1 DnaJ-like protein DjlA [Actinobacillus pleuropneumoniae serovar 7 str. AP76]ASU16234.1 Co-chaperone protein DjlA [Actinobacillus pleuropneumoniae]AWG94714.1 co-chaperone DjlA [Actinobacillus pleuropneumoniae serovar 1 str. 4074]
MQFIGKIIGFFIGYKLFGGIFGGLLGVFIGHLADKKLYELGSVRSSIFGKNLTRQSLFTQTTFAVLGHIAKAKGRVTEDDIHLARLLMARLKLDANAQQLAQQAFTLGKEADFPLRQVIQEFREACGQRADLLRFFVEVQMQAALQDGQLDSNEQQILFTIAETMGMSRFQFEQMIAMVMAAQQFRSGGFYQQSQQQSGSYHQSQGNYGGYRPSGPNVKDAYTVLGVTENDDQNTVKRAYRKLMNEHHPDKLAAKGLPDEMMELAKEKAQQIQAAYDLICKTKGWK